MFSVAQGFLIFLGGLGLFLYAITRFGDGVQKVVGERIRKLLEAQATKPFASITTGIAMAAALQNNFLTYGMISSLLNAGLLGLLPAIWIMLGANLGMTITAHFMALNIGAISFALLFVGYLFYSYAKKRTWHYVGQIIFNLALMFLGLDIFHRAFQIFAYSPSVMRFIISLLTHPWLAFLLGLSLAALIRSSNAMVVIMQGLVGVGLGLTSPVFLSSAFAVIIGANVGTTFINMLLGLDRIPTAKKANWLHFAFNLTTALVWLALLPVAYFIVHSTSVQLTTLINWFSLSIFKWSPFSYLITENGFNIWQLAMVHTMFNMTVILIWFPMTLLAEKLGFSLFAEKGKIGKSDASYLDRRALHSPALALILAAHEINQMASITLEMLKSARQAFLKGQIHLLTTIERDETVVDELQEQITFYLSALLSQNSLTESQSHRLAGLLHAVTDIERVGDHANNIARLAEKKNEEQLPFSELALNEIELLFGKAIDVYSKVCQALREDNLELAKQIQNREETIDQLEEELRHNHIYRLNQGKCWPGSGVIYVEMLSNLQRVSAHSANIAATVIEEGEE